MISSDQNFGRGEKSCSVTGAAQPLLLRPAHEPLLPDELCFVIGFPIDFQNYDAEPTLIVSPLTFVGTMPMNANGQGFWCDNQDDLSRPVYHFEGVALNGHSGSPVVDTLGRVVGVWVASHNYKNKSFVQPLADFLSAALAVAGAN